MVVCVCILSLFLLLLLVTTSTASASATGTALRLQLLPSGGTDSFQIVVGHCVVLCGVPSEQRRKITCYGKVGCRFLVKLGSRCGSFPCPALLSLSLLPSPFHKEPGGEGLTRSGVDDLESKITPLLLPVTSLREA